MKFFESLNTLISIAAGFVTLWSAFGLYKIDEATKTLEVGNLSIYFFLAMGVLIFICSLFQRRSINNITNVQLQNQFGGSDNRQTMR